MPPGDWRLFVALPVPDDVAVALDVHLAPLHRRYPDARWVPAVSRHLTLVFLGWVSPATIDQVAAAIDRASAGHRAIRIELGSGGGIARPRGDGVAWLTLRHGGERVSALATALASDLPPPPLGGRPAGERPHMTVARRASAALIRDLAALPEPWPPLAWLAGEVVLFRSRLEATGARYEVVHARSLASSDATRRPLPTS